MAPLNCLVLFITVFCCFTSHFHAEVNDDTKEYIVYMGAKSDKYSASSEHISLLQQVVKGRSAEEAIIQSYTRSLNGFAARLTQKEYENLKSMDNVVSVFPSRTLQLQTTRSWDFLGIPEPSPKQKNAQSNVIIGVIDTGIWPESPSINDRGLSPVPKKWKGQCDGGHNFTCNRKIIGARSYTSSKTARDDYGHGSHTASIAAGRKVKDVSFYNIAKGTARGGVPSSRIAVYKVCDIHGCNATFERNVMAAFDDAIADGVDLITISMGAPSVADFNKDCVAIGAFHAISKGILTVQATGNSGDQPKSVLSVAPWILSVAASSMDRRIIAKIELGDGKELIGNSVNVFTSNEYILYEMVYGKGATSTCDEATAKLCEEACIDTSLVKGKILVCDSPRSFKIASKSGAFGLLEVSRSDDVSDVFPLPATALRRAEFHELQSYLISTKAPVGTILKSETINDTAAPLVASFSSRGPNPIASDILKPDISAPGVDILAAFSPKASVSGYEGDKRSVRYSVSTGTSMSCPHVAGVAALVKSVHPDWSPSAIKSALMTTADQMSPTNNPDAEFAYGSGHLNPSKATHPGLVYETTENDYITFLCKSGYDHQKITLLTGNNNITCPKKPDISPKDTNYPSMAALVDYDKPFRVTFTRTVTNVGNSNSTYRAGVRSGSDVKVTVKPNILSFKSLKERKSFQVTVVGKRLSEESMVSSDLVWVDGVHTVRSPIVVYTATPLSSKEGLREKIDDEISGQFNKDA